MEMANVVDKNTWWSAMDAMGEGFGVSTVVRGLHAFGLDDGCSVVPTDSNRNLGDSVLSFIGFACTNDSVQA